MVLQKHQTELLLLFYYYYYYRNVIIAVFVQLLVQVFPLFLCVFVW
jgi:hypothetical protein